jgi:hypothetical protein
MLVTARLPVYEWLQRQSGDWFACFPHILQRGSGKWQMRVRRKKTNSKGGGVMIYSYGSQDLDYKKHLISVL